MNDLARAKAAYDRASDGYYLSRLPAGDERVRHLAGALYEATKDLHSTVDEVVRAEYGRDWIEKFASWAERK